MDDAIRSKRFTDMRVWQAAHRHVLAVYRATKTFPKDELFGLTSQMRRAAVSISSNIAEGFGRTSRQEKLRFYGIAYGSAMEIENQLMIAGDLGYVPREEIEKLLAESLSVQRQLNGLTSAISATINP